MNILVTGGLGYIGSHTALELAFAGHTPIIIDNLCNSEEWVLTELSDITGSEIRFYRGDILDIPLVGKIFRENSIDAVMHFAGLKSVPESELQPLTYYKANVTGTQCLCEVMAANSCKKIIFSSSACVYGISGNEPIRETEATSPKNVYGRTKLTVEQILTDVASSDTEWGVALLRYFNPIGAHASGRIGEIPSDKPGNLMPFITRVANGSEKTLFVTGTDFDTPDGSGVRDYIHVVDLAKGHVAALDYISAHKGADIFNLGTGRGYSVFEIISAFEEATGIKIPYEKAPRRPGDLAMYYADPSKARKTLHWDAELGLKDMCRDSWRFAEYYYKRHAKK